MAKRKQEYGNDSISMLEGADRVRKRPGVIFGSDGLEGCEHAVFEILSNAIDEAREGYGREIILTPLPGRAHPGGGLRPGLPRGLETKRWASTTGSWCSASSTPGASTTTPPGDNYEYSLGLNGLGACATQYASAFMDVTVRRDGKRYDLHFEKGQPGGGDDRLPRRPEKDGHHHHLAARPGGLYPDRHPQGILHRRPPPPGSGERRHPLPLPGPGGARLYRDRLHL